MPCCDPVISPVRKSIAHMRTPRPQPLPASSTVSSGRSSCSACRSSHARECATSAELPSGVRRCARSLTGCVTSAVRASAARICNGFHFRTGLEAGVEMGRDRAAHILNTQLVRRREADGVSVTDQGRRSGPALTGNHQPPPVTCTRCQYRSCLQARIKPAMSAGDVMATHPASSLSSRLAAANSGMASREYPMYLQ